MTKKYKKILLSGILFMAFSCLCFSCFAINQVLADGLGMQAPASAGQATGAGTGMGSSLPAYMIYLFNLGMSIGIASVFISLTIGGIMYFLAPISAEARANAGDRVSGAVSGLLILLSTYLIITTINPQLSVFKLGGSLPEVNLPKPTETRTPGVYFYKSGCDDTTATPNKSSITDLGDLKNKVRSAEIVQDSATHSSYVSILYDKVDLWGKCQDVDPNGGCQTVDPSAESASIYEYDSAPNGDGVYFYHGSCFNDQAYSKTSDLVAYCNKNSGGYYEVNNSDIGGIYTHSLESLKFVGVPTEKQDCIKYDATGKCIGRNPPSLGGENISSIIVNGSYVVLLVYKSPQDSDSGPWTSCQEFPTTNDINKTGPRQIKWEAIRNSGGVVPNYVAIIPVK